MASAHAQERQISEFSAGKSHKYQLSAQEYNLLSTLIANDVESFSGGARALITDELGVKQISSNDLAKAYRANEVAGDRDFKRKTLFVTGKVERIGSGIGDAPYFVMGPGINAPQAHIADEALNFAANTKKGQLVRLVCLGNGSIMGTAMLKDCLPAETVAERESKKLVRRLDLLLSGAGTDETAAKMASVVVAIAASLKPAECTSPGAVCMKAVNRVTAQKDFSWKLDEAARRLKEAGVRMPS
nr:hypothetical protein [Achromobacter mucicolens]